MRKLFLFIATGFLLSRAGAVPAPVDAQGHALATSDWIGVNTCIIDSSTGTTGLLCYTGPAIVYGVIASSVPVNTYVVIRDSAAVVSASTAVIVWASGSGSNSSGGGTTQIFPFPRPIKMTTGVSAVSSASLPAGGNIANWTILYRPRNVASE